MLKREKNSEAASGAAPGLHIVFFFKMTRYLSLLKASTHRRQRGLDNLKAFLEVIWFLCLTVVRIADMSKTSLRAIAPANYLFEPLFRVHLLLPMVRCLSDGARS